MTGEACCVRMISSCFLFPATISPNTHPPSHPERAGSGSGRHRQQEEGKGDDKDVHDVATTWRVLMKPMLVVRRLSAGVRGRCGCGQGQQKGARRLSSTTESSSTNGAVYWGRQWEKAKEAAPVVVSVLGFGAVIAEGTRRQVEVGTKEAVLRGELEKKDVELRGELEKKDAVLRGELEKKDVELEKKEAVLRGELATRDAVMRGEIAKLRGEMEKKDALRGGEVDRRILDLLTRGDYDRARMLLEERANARLAGLAPSPSPPPSST
jgi:uncharacterized small protein (DUF1192 family)